MIKRISAGATHLLLVLLSIPAIGAALSQDAAPSARDEAVPVSSVYVTVPLEAYANDFKEAAFPARRVTLDGIPFDLVDKTGVNHLFLKAAGWPDWKIDPPSSYSEYDLVPKERSPKRPLFQVPVADYSAVWLLAAADPSPDLSPVVSFRVGVMNYATRVTYHDFSAIVPRTGEKTGPGVRKTLATKDGNLFLMRVPVGRSFAQDFKDHWHLDVEVTKELRLAIHRPDPCRFQVRPLGLPSGVRIYGMTFERSAVQMEVTSDESGHIFNEPQIPTFHVTLRNPTRDYAVFSLKGVATDYDGHATTNQFPETLRIAPGSARRVDLSFKTPQRGYHDLAISADTGNGIAMQRDTTFALLPENTRRHRDGAPVGTWDFNGQHYTPDNSDVTGPLYVKAGLRYGMFGDSEEMRRKYGVLNGLDPKIWPRNKEPAKAVAAEAARLKANPSEPMPKRWMIFHEDVISEAHVTRLPDLFTGRPAYVFNKEEAKTFRELWSFAETGARAIRKEFPDAEIYFGNGPATLLEEFVRYRFPKELLGSRGNESATFQRLPETQPLDPVANNSSLWMDRQILDHYGYRDTPLRQCVEMCCPSTSPGNLSPRTHAAYLIRHIMHSLAWKIPIIRPSIITDTGNSYYFSNWGAAGICYGKPEIRPKPAYVALATMTLLLDGAQFTRVVPCGSPSVYAIEFKRKDRQVVTVLWTIRGKRSLKVKLASGSKATLTDLMGHARSVPVADKSALVEISPDPVFLETGDPVSRIDPGAAVMEGRPAGKSFLISSLGALGEWTVEPEANRELESYNFLCPRRKGDFIYREIDQFEGESKVLEIKPRLPVPGLVYLPMYSVLKLNKAVELPGQPTEIGLMVNGNGGWGRVIFEMEDASGQRWISIGAEQEGAPPNQLEALAGKAPAPPDSEKPKMGINDWNTDDAWGRSAINFEGWRYLRFPLPGNYPGEGYHWPYSSQWRFNKEGVVKYPLKFTRLIVTIPEKVLHFTEYAPVPRQEIYLRDLMATYEPPEKAFVAE